MDRATDSGSVGRGFKSLRARYFYKTNHKIERSFSRSFLSLNPMYPQNKQIGVNSLLEINLSFTSVLIIKSYKESNSLSDNVTDIYQIRDLAIFAYNASIFSLR